MGSSVVDKSSVPGSKKEIVTVAAKDMPTLSPGCVLLPGGMQLPDDANVRNFFFVLLQMMLQISPASQNVSHAPGREENNNDNGEKEVEVEEEVDAVDLCTSDDEKMKKTKTRETKLFVLALQFKKIKMRKS